MEEKKDENASELGKRKYESKMSNKAEKYINRGKETEKRACRVDNHISGAK
jgi:hypothetical protein